MAFDEFIKMAAQFFHIFKRRDIIKEITPDRSCRFFIEKFSANARQYKTVPSSFISNNPIFPCSNNSIVSGGKFGVVLIINSLAFASVSIMFLQAN